MAFCSGSVLGVVGEVETPMVVVSLAGSVVLLACSVLASYNSEADETGKNRGNSC